MKYVKKPVTIEAWHVNCEPMPNWIRAAFRKIIRRDANGFMVDTLEGSMWAPHGSYIIKGVKGELYPCREDIFNETYSMIEE